MAVTVGFMTQKKNDLSFLLLRETDGWILEPLVSICSVHTTLLKHVILIEHFVGNLEVYYVVNNNYTNR